MKPMRMLYFAYGSNMPKALIEERVGPCKRIGVAYITGYALRFHKESQVDHTGKCDAYCTGDPSDRVWGAIYRLTQDQIAEMDELEGPGYRRATVQTTLSGWSVQGRPLPRKAGRRETRAVAPRQLQGVRARRRPRTRTASGIRRRH